MKTRAPRLQVRGARRPVTLQRVREQTVGGAALLAASATPVYADT